MYLHGEGMSADVDKAIANYHPVSVSG